MAEFWQKKLGTKKKLKGSTMYLVENGGGDCQGSHSIRRIHNTGDPSFAWAARQQQVNKLDISGRVVISNNSSSPVHHLNPKDLIRVNLSNWGDKWVPSVVKR
ncbi:hypothetical protein SDJN02_04025, partial [Cucurbita argyrosperma subsp. argyrosperma]